MKIGITTVSNVIEEWTYKDLQDLKEALTEAGAEAKMIYADSLDMELSKSGITPFQSGERAAGASKGRERIDVDGVLLRHLGTIRDYEQFTYRIFCIKAFEELGLPVMNPVLPWLFATDKFGALMRLSAKGIPVPETVVTEHMFVGYSALKRLGPSVVKPLRSAMGFGIFKVDDPDLGMHAFSYLTNMNKPIYVQKFLEKKGSGDYRVVVVGGKVEGAEFRKGITWKSNVAQGAIPKKAKLDEELKELAVKSCEILGLDYAGIDIASTKEGYFVLETNPTLSWQGFRKATGINPAKSIANLILSRAHR